MLLSAYETCILKVTFSEFSMEVFLCHLPLWPLIRAEVYLFKGQPGICYESAPSCWPCGTEFFGLFYFCFLIICLFISFYGIFKRVASALTVALISKNILCLHLELGHSSSFITTKRKKKVLNQLVTPNYSLVAFSWQTVNPSLI